MIACAVIIYHVVVVVVGKRKNNKIVVNPLLSTLIKLEVDGMEWDNGRQRYLSACREGRTEFLICEFQTIENR